MDIHDEYEIQNRDCIPAMLEMAPHSIDLSVFSPPFSSLYAYTEADADMGNSRESDDEFMLHFDFFARALAPLIKPGRNVCMHLQQVSRFKSNHGYMGLYDIRGQTIRVMEAAGLHYYGDITIPKNPQAQAIRTKSHCLTFTQFEKDSTVSRPALSDYLLVFKAPGDNAVPVRPEVSREDWIEWASGVWHTICETDTLNTDAAKSDQDERHVCPLQLDLIERCVRLWSNRGETVFSPFMGVGSEGFKSLQLRRKFKGAELNPRYYGVAKRNLDRAMMERDAQQPLFGRAS